MCDFEQHIRGMYYNLLLVYFTHSIATTPIHSLQEHTVHILYVGADLV